MRGDTRPWSMLVHGSLVAAMGVAAWAWLRSKEDRIEIPNRTVLVSRNTKSDKNSDEVVKRKLDTQISYDPYQEQKHVLLSGGRSDLTAMRHETNIRRRKMAQEYYEKQVEANLKREQEEQQQQ